jgi:alcohol dehydrogenase class IV
VHETLTVGEFLKTVRMEMKARVVEQLNCQQVQRTVFRQNSSEKCQKNVEKVAQIAMMGKQLQIR